MEREGILSQSPFGFRSGLGTADLLTSLHHECLPSLSANGVVHILAVDIAGAFDKVSHPDVLHKLRVYGVCGSLHKWLRNYLSCLSLQIVVTGKCLGMYPIGSGVPQGSILGPCM